MTALVKIGSSGTLSVDSCENVTEFVVWKALTLRVFLLYPFVSGKITMSVQLSVSRFECALLLRLSKDEFLFIIRLLVWFPG